MNEQKRLGLIAVIPKGKRVKGRETLEGESPLNGVVRVAILSCFSLQPQPEEGDFKPGRG